MMERNLENTDDLDALEAQEDSFADSWREEETGQYSRDSLFQRHFPDGGITEAKEDDFCRTSSFRRESIQSERHSVNDEHDETWDAVAKFHNRKVLIQKLIFVSVLVVAAASTSALTYYLLSTTEQQSFEREYYDLGTKLSDGFGREFELQVLAAQALSAGTTSEAKFHNLRWPLVIVPDFKARTMGTARVMASSVCFGPLVTNETLDEWESFVIQNKKILELTPDEVSVCRAPNVSCRTIDDGMYHFNKTVRRMEQGPTSSTGPYFPMLHANTKDVDTWAPWIMADIYSGIRGWAAVDEMMQTKGPALFELQPEAVPAVVGRPSTALIAPVFESFQNGNIVGWYGFDFHWQAIFHRIAQPTHGSIIAVLKTSAGDVLSFEISPNNSTYLGIGDWHEPNYDEYEVSKDLDKVVDLSSDTSSPLDWNTTQGSFRGYSLHIYPADSFKNAFVTSQPAKYSAIVASIFAFSLIMFAAYDILVERRQKHVMSEAKKFNTLVDSLFPRTVHQRLFKRTKNSKNQTPSLEECPNNTWHSRVRADDTLSVAPKSPFDFVEPAKLRLRKFIRHKEATSRDHRRSLAKDCQYHHQEPIADLFPACTIMFADIAGFTAWSSEREPSQVFFLLETLYGEFDQLASNLGVFKVETIGDCYVAVTGLPDPIEDHAIVMAEFADECLHKMRHLVSQLESLLGPGTSDLDLRIGLHSGPVTAGVLRGERARFQLFGDTMNTASRMESTGERSRIQVSEETYRLLKQAGRDKWLTKRDRSVNAKGKGDLQTWWLSRVSRAETPRLSSLNLLNYLLDSKRGGDWGQSTLDEYGIDLDKQARLVRWNTEILGDLLSKLAIRRAELPYADSGDVAKLNAVDSSSFSVLEEVADVIQLPEYRDGDGAYCGCTNKRTKLDRKVQDQLHHYVMRIADRYKDNSFHSFEHASHVTLSAQKLLKRIVSPCESHFGSMQQEHAVAKRLHEATFGIASDPLCQFAVVFSTLIHDCDHQGVSNCQLVKEGADVAVKYNNKSVAEQNSVDIAWGILMEEQYQDLRDCIFPSESELHRFRQLIVNLLIATDIFDEDLKERRFHRWTMAFGSNDSSTTMEVHRKATIVLECIIQASDIAHTMQHWEVYSKWMQRLFWEHYSAYLAGRRESDPSEGWYEAELSFFDDYVIPLAKKLQSCGVFGVASDEYLIYALNNREEWKRKGMTIVADLTMHRSCSNIEEEEENFF